MGYTKILVTKPRQCGHRKKSGLVHFRYMFENSMKALNLLVFWKLIACFTRISSSISFSQRSNFLEIKTRKYNSVNFNFFLY